MPSDLVQIIRNMYVESKGIIRGKYYGDFFEFMANIGVKQGDGASPELFSIFFDRIFPYILAYYREK